MELLYYNVQPTCIFHDMKEWRTIKHWEELENNPKFQNHSLNCINKRKTNFIKSSWKSVANQVIQN